MPKRSFAMAIAMAMAPLAIAAFSAPSKAASMTTVTAVNTTGLAANDFEATFIGTGGSVGNIHVLFSSGVGTATSVISSGSGTRIDFSPALPNFGVLVYQFTTAFGPVTLNTAQWTFTNHAPIAATAVSLISTAAVPEPSTLALGGIGGLALVAFARRRRRAG